MLQRGGSKYLYLFIAVLLVLVFGLFAYQSFAHSLTGKISFSFGTSYYEGEPIAGTLKVHTQQGELIPADSVVRVSLGNEVKEVLLSDLISTDTKLGLFYAEQASLSGFGSGYGLPGKRDVAKEVEFEIQVRKSVSQTTTGSSGGKSVSSRGDALTAGVSSEPTSSDSGRDSGDSGSSGLTGLVVDSRSGSDKGSLTASDSSDSEKTDESSKVDEDVRIVSATAKKGEPYRYSLASDESASLVSGSVSVEGRKLLDASVDFSQRGGEIVVTTDYTEEVEGYGKDFIGKDTHSFDIDLQRFGLIAQQDSNLMSVDLVYMDNLIAREQRSIHVVQRANNGTNTTVPPEPNASVRTHPEGMIRIGQPVVWRKEIVMSYPADRVVVELPEGAVNARVVEVEKRVNEESKISLVVVRSDNVDEVEVIEREEGIELTDVSRSALQVTGNVAVELELDKERGFVSRVMQRLMQKLTGRVIDEKLQEDLVLEGSVEKVVVEYETPAPYSVEQEELESKQVMIVGPEGFDYENVLAFTSIPVDWNVRDANRVSIFWRENPSYLPVYEFESENGVITSVSWIVPHLSNQTFDIVLVTDAQHLDENRSFISNIFESVASLDGEWSETIPAGHFVRVSFEKNLTNVNDITVYPRIVSGNPKIEVYEVNEPFVIAQFNSLSENQYNKVILHDLIGEQDSFDLKILNGDVEFDHIIDPAVSGCVNITIAGTYSLANSIASNGTCFRVSVNNVIVDGQGYSLTGNGSGIGIDARGYSGLTLLNISISNFANSASTAANVSGGNAGSVYVNYSTIQSVNASGGGNNVEPSGSGGNAGLITVTESTVSSRISGRGGDGCSGFEKSCFGGSGGAGSNLIIQGASVNLDNVLISIAGGAGFDGVSSISNLKINYTSSFSDLGANYSTGAGGVFFEMTSSDSGINWMTARSLTGVYNFSSRVHLSNNLAGVDSPSILNASANVTLYGMPGTFTNPKIYKDGQQCTNCYNFTSLNAATVIFNVTSFSNYSIQDETSYNVSSCTSLSVAGATYTQTANIVPNSAGACINITAANVVFNCQGYSMSNSSFNQPAIYSNNLNSTIKNCNISIGTSLNADGIRFDYASNSTVFNNTFNDVVDGIHTTGVSGARIENNTFNPSASIGVHLNSSSFNIVRGNSFLGASFYGVWMGDSNYNNISNNLVEYESQTGINFNGASYNYIYNNTINGSTAAGIYMTSGSQNNTINLTTIRNAYDGFYIAGSASNNRIYNVSLSNSGNRDLNIDQAGISGTNLVDTIIGPYTIAGVGGTIIVRETGFGEIRFLQAVNGSGSNLSDDLQIDSNFVYTNAPGLNRSANITLYNLPVGFGQPVILRDGQQCTNCHNFTSLNAATVIFNVTSFSNYTIGENLTSCLATCTEGSSCSITSACWLYSGLCTDEVCNFADLNVSAPIYALYSGVDGNNLTINLTGNITFSNGNLISVNARDGSVGGNAGVLNITVPGLFNRTAAVLQAIGGFTSATATAGGNGGIIQINYHGLIGSSFGSGTSVLAGNSTSGISGTNGTIVLSKDLSCPRDQDVTNDGRISIADSLRLINRYNNISTDSGFSDYDDINCDSKLNVIELSRVGFVINTR